MRVAIRFTLSEIGQKAALLAGQNTDRNQELEISPDNPCFRAVVKAGTIRGNQCILDCSETLGGGYNQPRIDVTEWDHVPLEGSLLADQARRRAEYEDAVAEREKTIRDDTLAVLRDKRTRTTKHVIGAGATAASYEAVHPDWPSPRDVMMLESDEARAWQQELEDRNEQAKAGAEQEYRRLKAEVEAEAKAKRLAAEAAEAARREALGLQDGEEDYTVESGALTRVPKWSNHHRSRCWMAVYTLDPSKPGGLDRTFADKAKGRDAYYMLPDLRPGQTIEFAADYYSGSGRKSPDRWYGYVARTEVEDGNGYVVLVECPTAKGAAKQAANFLAGKG